MGSGLQMGTLLKRRGGSAQTSVCVWQLQSGQGDARPTRGKGRVAGAICTCAHIQHRCRAASTIAQRHSHSLTHLARMPSHGHHGNRAASPPSQPSSLDPCLTNALSTSRCLHLHPSCSTIDERTALRWLPDRNNISRRDTFGCHAKESATVKRLACALSRTLVVWGSMQRKCTLSATEEHGQNLENSLG